MRERKKILMRRERCFRARSFSIATLLCVLFVSSGVLGNSAFAAEKSTWSAQMVGRSAGIIHMLAGQAVTVWIDFQNTGTATWKNSGANFVAINPTNPVGRRSVFATKSWSTAYRPAIVQQSRVAPGQTGRFRFALQAPKTPGTYEEHFQLAVKNIDWMAGGEATLPIVVDPIPPAYQAAQNAASFSHIQVTPGQVFTVSADFKNTGLKTWTSTGKNFLALNVTHPSGRTSPFFSSTWKQPYRPTQLTGADIKRNQTAHFTFTLQAPATAGEYVENFQLVAENKAWIPGSVLTIPVTVAAPPVEQTTGEPSLDVGLRALDGPSMITAAGSMSVTQNDVVLATEPANGHITLSYVDGTYSATGTSFSLTSASPYWVAPGDAQTILTAENYENRPAWNASLNDNSFRGNLSIQYSTTTKKLWLINRLPLEQYLRGIAELSNSAPAEYAKALIIAARSYAQYNITNPSKHAAEHFTIDTVYDQVYRGYNFEMRSPNITAAVIATSGIEVTYQGSPSITPYFSQTDGRTRDWTEVWSGGPYAWLVSIPVPEDAGLPLLGHGVGMSAHGALVMASDEGKTYDQILAYFYTGTSVMKEY